MSKTQKELDRDLYTEGRLAGEKTGKMLGYQQAKQDLQERVDLTLAGGVIIAVIAGALGFVIGVGIFSL